MAQPQPAPQQQKESGAQQFLKGVGKRITTGAEGVSRSVKIQTLKAEIVMKESNIKGVKQEFGVQVYDAMEKGDQAETARVYNEYKAKIDGINAEIAAKKLEISELEKLATPRG